jgi:hypothetical protein
MQLRSELTTIDGETGEIIAVANEPRPFELTPLGLAVYGEPSITEWVVFGRELFERRSAVQWTIGDWLNYGEARQDWGEKYDQALGGFEYDYDYLRNMAWVAKSVPSSRRRVTVSWSHHQVVAALPPGEQVAWLEQAEKNKWDRDTFREKVKPKPNRPAKPIRLNGLDGAPCKIVRVNTEARFAVIEFDETPAGYAALKALVALWRDEESGLLLTVAQHLKEAEL